jgi:uncharacterized protein
MGRSPEIRDPLHGAIEVEPPELALMDHAALQRLRHIGQLGFTNLVFPGATHVRYLHAAGAMHLAGRAFDSLFEDPATPAIPSSRKRELRRLLRTAALLHDVGHAPFSHSVEFAMPSLAALDVPAYAEDPDRFDPARQADHEDYGIKLITDSSLTRAIEADGALTARAVAGLIAPIPVDPACYEAGGIDWRPLLQQIVSSELDVDRMDYLARDSHFAGVRYGLYDVGWLMNNLAVHVAGGRAFLALRERAIYAFDDFLLARYHMFVMVYFHYRSVVYEEMLKRYFSSGEWEFPVDIEQYSRFDDHSLLGHLRGSSNPWARRIVERREYKLLLERHGTPDEPDLTAVVQRLGEAGIPQLTAASRGVLSKYFEPKDGSGNHDVDPLWVLSQPYRGATHLRPRTLRESTELFDRYAGPLRMKRVYVPPERMDEAGSLIEGLV